MEEEWRKELGFESGKRVELKGARLVRAREIVGRYFRAARVRQDPLGKRTLFYQSSSGSPRSFIGLGAGLGSSLPVPVEIPFPLDEDQWLYIWFGKKGMKKIKQRRRKK